MLFIKLRSSWSIYANVYRKRYIRRYWFQRNTKNSKKFFIIDEPDVIIVKTLVYSYNIIYFKFYNIYVIIIRKCYLLKHSYFIIVLFIIDATDVF
jgi:hypothetical protein